MTNRLRIGFALTTILGTIYTAAAIFDSLTHIAIGLCVASAGIIGYGAIDYTNARHDDRIYHTRVDVWQRRDQGAGW